ncbi:MAG: hypothetical protein HYZ14_17785 [Bacteroidetes bacterium]|nr:hypothetical protein [Bacteroidota bacterium]
MKPVAAIYEVWYLRIWGTFHVVVGAVFSVIFMLGAVVLNDYSFLLYLLFSGLLLYMGLVRLRKPYLVYSPNKIEVRGTYGEIYKTYTWEKADEVSVKDNRIFLNGKKLRFNAWFTNKHQYNRMIRFFSGEILVADELQD